MRPKTRKSTESSATSLPTVLLTGFDPFGGASINPSWLAVSALHDRCIEGHVVVAAQLPTTFANSIEELARLLTVHQPKLVICTGQAGGRHAISIERIAINIQDARIQDNLGAQPVDQAIDADADSPAAYFSTLPIKAMLLALENVGLKAEISQTAGTFVCNHVFYGLMRLLHDAKTASGQAGNPAARGGFIHLPWLPEQGEPSMLLNQMVDSLEICVSSALLTRHDAAYGAGQLS